MKKFFLCFLFLLLITGCRSDIERSDTLSKKFKESYPACIGRHLIDLPEAFKQPVGLTAIFVQRRANVNEDAFDIQVQVIDAGLTFDDFSRRVEAREAKLGGRTWGRANVLKEARRIDDSVRVFQIQEIKEAYSTEIHALIEGTYIVMTAASYKNQFLLAESRMVEFLEGVSASASPSAAEDFCLGSVRIRGDFVKERAGFVFRSERFPEVMISVDYDTYVADPSQDLLARVDGPQSLLRAFDADNKVIRKGDLTVASMPAQEWLSWIVLGDGDKTKNYGFAMETMQRTPSTVQPFIHVELDAKFPLDGEASAKDLSESEIIGLWDVTTRSLRLRASRPE